MYTKYLIEFIAVLLGYTFFGAGMIFVICLIIKDFKIKKQISSGRISYMYTDYKTSKFKTFMVYLRITLISMFLGVMFIFIQVPLFMDIPSLISGNFQQEEGVVTKVVRDKSITSIYINDEKLLESVFLKSAVDQQGIYQISYLKHSKKIIKVRKL